MKTVTCHTKVRIYDKQPEHVRGETTHTKIGALRD